MPDFISIENNPVPDGAECFYLDAADGVRLRAAVFSVPNAKGGVVLLGGRCEFIEKYFEVIIDLQARGFCVATMDWRGQGLSDRLLAEPLKGHVDNFSAFRSDLRLLTEDVAKKRFAGPLILVTHSMGGAPALQLLADGYDAFEAAVLCAPMTRLFANPVSRSAVRLMAGIASGFGAGRQTIAGVKEHSLKFDGNVLTSDAFRHDRFLRLQQAAPEAVIRSPTYGWLKAATAASADLHAPGRFEKLRTPTLIVSAEHDQLIDASDHAALAARSPLIECVTVDGALHEILMEQERYRGAFWRAFDGFILPRLEKAA